MIEISYAFTCDAPECDVNSGRSFRVQDLREEERPEPAPPADWARINGLIYCHRHVFMIADGEAESEVFKKIIAGATFSVDSKSTESNKTEGGDCDDTQK